MDRGLKTRGVPIAGIAVFGTRAGGRVAFAGAGAARCSLTTVTTGTAATTPTTDEASFGRVEITHEFSLVMHAAEWRSQCRSAVTRDGSTGI